MSITIPQWVVKKVPILGFFAMFFCWIWLSFSIGSQITNVIMLANKIFILPLFGPLKFAFSYKYQIFYDYIFYIFNGTLNGILVILGLAPLIFFVFLFLGFAQKSGYINLISAKLSGLLMRYFGVDAQIFVPLFTGFGCTVPAYIAISAMPNKKQQFFANVIVSFIPCSAKYTVFSLFCLAIFGQFYGTIALMLIYVFSIIFGFFLIKVIASFLPKQFYQNNQNISITKLQTIQIRNIVKPAYAKVVEYCKNVFKTILIFSFCFSVFNSFGFGIRHGFYINITNNLLTPTIVMSVSQFLSATLFAPLHLPWQIVFAIIAGFSAKEVSIAALGVVLAPFVLSDGGIVGVVLSTFSTKVAIEFLVFMFFYMPCISATATLKKQSKSYKQPLFIFAITTFFAYFGALLVALF